MDPRLLRYYNQELRYLREMGGEFAREFPKIAGRLGMEGLEVADPYVERLLEGLRGRLDEIERNDDWAMKRQLVELLVAEIRATGR